MIIKITKNWKYAHDGVRVVEYEPGVVDLPDLVAERAIADGVAEKASASEKSKELKGQKDEARDAVSAEKQAPEPSPDSELRRELNYAPKPELKKAEGHKK